MKKLFVILALCAGPVLAAGLDAPRGGWNVAGLTDRANEAEVAYPTPPINRGAQRNRRMIEGRLKAAGKTRVARAQPAPSGDRPIVMISDEQRYRMVAEAAYYRAERNAFKSDPVRDWIEAEHDIELLLNGQS